MPFVLPSLKRILAPLLTNSGFLMNLNMTDACGKGVMRQQKNILGINLITAF